MSTLAQAVDEAVHSGGAICRALHGRAREAGLSVVVATYGRDDLEAVDHALLSPVPQDAVRQLALALCGKSQALDGPAADATEIAGCRSTGGEVGDIPGRDDLEAVDHALLSPVPQDAVRQLALALCGDRQALDGPAVDPVEATVSGQIALIPRHWGEVGDILARLPHITATSTR